MKFTEMNLSDAIIKTVNQLQFEEATEIQEKCIPAIMQGHDVIGKSQTGSGKTFAYGIPLVELIDPNLKAVQMLVVCPTRELANQVSGELKKITANFESIKTVPIFGGASMSRQIEALKKNAKIVVGTPGRLMDHLQRKTLKLNNLKMIVLDEADEMLNMGFKNDIETILSSANKVHQTVMFSATMPDAIYKITNQFMKDAKFIEIGSKIQLANTIEQSFIYHDKQDALMQIIEQYNPYAGIVFCNTIRMSDKLTKYLIDNGIAALCLNGDMPQNARKRTMDNFKAGKAQLLIGTDVAARGLDVKNVDLVINYDLPFDMEYYIHRIGRTGRAGQKGKAINLIANAAQKKELALLEKQLKTTIKQIVLEGDKTFELSAEKDSAPSRRTRGSRTESGSRRDGRNSSGRSSSRTERSNSYSSDKSERRGRKSYSNNSQTTDKQYNREKPDFSDKSRKYKQSSSSNQEYGNKNSQSNRSDRKSYSDQVSSEKTYSSRDKFNKDSRSRSYDKSSTKDHSKKTYGDNRKFDKTSSKPYDKKFDKSADKPYGKNSSKSRTSTLGSENYKSNDYSQNSAEKPSQARKSNKGFGNFFKKSSTRKG